MFLIMRLKLFNKAYLNLWATGAILNHAGQHYDA
jgi:hypothetical protein